MKLETSLFNRGIFFNNFKRIGWFGLVYFLILVFSVPFQIFMIYSSRPETQYFVMKEIFYFGTDIQSLLILIIPVLLAILLFRYLQVKNSAVLIHSLPIKRGTLFFTHIVTGITCLAVPVVLTAGIAWTLKAGLDLDAFYTGTDILKWIGITLSMNIVFFLTAVLVGMVTGLSTAQGVLTYILLFLPTGISLLILLNLESFLYGFVFDTTREGAFTRLSPLFKILTNNIVQLNEVIGYLIVAIIFLILAYYFYGRRKIEGASQAIAFNGLKPIFKYGVTFCCMLVGGLYFREFQYNKYWILSGYLVGSLLGYLVAEIVLKKSFRIFANLKGYLYYVGVIILLLLTLNIDLTGYEKRIPALKEVESVYFGSEYFFQKKIENMPKLENDQSTVINERYFEQKNLENIRKFHLQIIDDKDKLQDNSGVRYYNNNRQFIFAYKLKNGQEIVRGYTVPVDEYNEFIKPIHESIEYKKMLNPILRVNSKQVDKIIIKPAGDLSKKAVIIDETYIKEVVEILQEEIRSASYEEMMASEQNWAYIELMLSNNEIVQARWNKNYKNLEAWLKLRGYWENARILPEDIEYAIVEEIDKDEWKEFPEEIGDGSVKRLKISDKGDLGVSLNYYYEWCAEHQYAITFFSAANRPVAMGYFENKNVPSFVKEYFE